MANMAKTPLIFLFLAGITAFSGPLAAAPKAKAVDKPKVADMASDADDYAYDDDPIAPFNRAMYQFNYGFDTVLLRPVTSGYRAVMPAKGQEMVHNAVGNLGMPVTFANSVLQADPQNAFASMWTFAINSTFGMAGLFDVASDANLKYRRTGLGDTFAIYGADAGPYLVVPFVGPSNVRDGLGLAGDAFTNPFNYIGWGFSGGYWGTTAVDKRSQNMKLIDDIYATSLDPYSTFKSGYTQHRASQIQRAKFERSQARRAAGLE